MVGRVVLAVGERPDEVDLGEHQLVHRDPGLVAPDRHVHDRAAGAHRPDRRAEHGVDARALERDVGARATGEVADRVGHVTSVGSSTSSAPAPGALALRTAAGSTTNTFDAPAALSAAVVTSPIGPEPNTAAVSPGLSPDSRTAW